MEDEIRIDFRRFFQIIWKEKWRIIFITILITVVGIAYALLSREEFESHGRILPEIQGRGSANLSQFAGIASLAGVDLGSLGGSGIDAVRPDLYPNVITSTPFYLKLFKTEVYTRENKKISFEEYYHSAIEDGKEPDKELLETYPVKEDGIIVVSRLSDLRVKNLRERITAEIDRKSGVITIQSKMPDPVVSANVTKFAMEYLMEYVKDYRTEKLRQDVDYLASQVSTSRGKYYSTQERKARYSDQFQDMRLQSADVQRERIESEYRLSSTFYNELLKKYEEAKFKLHQETPVFKVLEPPVVPIEKSEPKRKMIVLGFLFFGGIIGSIVVLFRKGNYKEIVLKK